jgi:long-chain acyl-CoA synthetase
LVFAPDPLPRAIAHSLAASKATVWPAVPAMFSPLLEAGFSGTPHLRTVISAGAPLSSALARRWHEQTGLPIRSFYGSSECGGICYDGGGRAGEIEGWVGHPMPAVHLQKATRVNEAFTIEITGDAVGQGCLPCHSGDSLQNGKFRPADLLEAVEDGFRLVGRMDDLVNLGGRKVHPSEVEAVLAGLPGVRAVVVCGVEGRGGEELLAVVEGSPELSPADLREQTAASLPAWQVPRHWQIVARLPYNERGKISRRELAKLWSGNRLEPHRRNRKLPARGT